MKGLPAIDRLSPYRVSRSLAESVVLISLILCGCNRVRAISDLQQRVAREFSSPDVAITLSNSTLIVGFHTELHSTSARDTLAIEVAEYVRDHYEAYMTLRTVEISFDSATNNDMFSKKRNRMVYRFQRNELGEPAKSSP